MTTEQLEALIEAQTEIPHVEFKEACAFHVRTFVRGILAMANLRDGGDIIVGVEDQTFDRQGLTQELLLTFNDDRMRDRLAKYADPHVRFTVKRVTGRDEKIFVVIHVFQFDEVPVICKCDDGNAKVCAGEIYYRSNTGRPASARVSNSYDMRSIIDTATVRMMQQRQSAGYTVISSEDARFDTELGGL